MREILVFVKKKQKKFTIQMFTNAKSVFFLFQKNKLFIFGVFFAVLWEG